MKIEARIKEAAKRQQVYSPTQLANLVGCAPTIIWRYWTKKQVPGLPMLYRIADALNCDPWDLVVRVNGNKRKRRANGR